MLCGATDQMQDPCLQAANADRDSGTQWAPMGVSCCVYSTPPGSLPSQSAHTGPTEPRTAASWRVRGPSRQQWRLLWARDRQTFGCGRCSMGNTWIWQGHARVCSNPRECKAHTKCHVQAGCHASGIKQGCPGHNDAVVNMLMDDLRPLSHLIKLRVLRLREEARPYDVHDAASDARVNSWISAASAAICNTHPTLRHSLRGHIAWQRATKHSAGARVQPGPCQM